MKLIDKIEINYFRSIYNVNVKSLEDLNIVIGGNDSGKSNLLRALNLFFNGKTSYDEELKFLQDVTHLRQKEARDQKGRLTIWMKVHFNNVENWKTLPDKFYVKKTWNRYSDDPEIKTNIENQQAETRFLNKIRFHYVPAVKEKDIFSNYLYLLYETLSDRGNIEFEGPAEQLSSAVNDAIIDLTDNIKINLDIDSKIRIPSDLQSIFERLEFSTEQDDFKVPLFNRGDGVQVRHIPHIIDYVSRNNNCLNIWGYEEPENSLEMSNSFRLAKEFQEKFSIKNQLIVTSHSPAFYGLEGDGTKHLVARKAIIEGKEKSHMVTEIHGDIDVNAADTELGVAQLIMKRSAAAYEEINRLREINKELEKINKPVILTEGKTDAAILEVAWDKLYPKKARNFEIKSCDVGGANDNAEIAGAGQLQKILEATTKHETNFRVGLFDRDGEGIKCFKHLKQHVLLEDNEEIKINRNKKSAALMLPKIFWEGRYQGFLHGDICIEMYFPQNTFSREELELKFTLSNQTITKKRAHEIMEKLNEQFSMFPEIELKVKPQFLSKVKFTKRLSKLPRESFINFKALFEAFQEALDILKN